jgi:hypothetical protein
MAWSLYGDNAAKLLGRSGFCCREIPGGTAVFRHPAKCETPFAKQFAKGANADTNC